MQRHLLGASISAVWTSRKRLREPLPRARLASLVGDRFTRATRRAKYLLLDLDSKRTLLVHLGMTGNLLFRDNQVLHDHVVFSLDQSEPGQSKLTQSKLVFSDPRRFGMVLVLEPDELEHCRYLQRIGPEPLSCDFDVDYMWSVCRARARPIKNLLLDGHVVAGIGNIYASEALFRAGIRPAVRASRLSKKRVAVLVEQIKAVLRQAIRQGGTTVSDYLGSGRGGRFQQQLAVYGRADENCTVCDAPVRSQVLAGRSSFYCPECQR
jgi:formamidopyrimidine-DNA glycosylase